MERSILGSRALRVACACALALGIAPAAAWGVADDEQPASDVDALQEVVEDMPQKNTLEKSEPAPDDDVDSKLVNEQAPGGGTGDDGDESGNFEPDKSKSDNTSSNETGTEPVVQLDTAATPTTQPLSESAADEAIVEPNVRASASNNGVATTQASTTYTLTLDSDSIDVELYRCPVCSGGTDGDIYHCSGLEEVGYQITSSDGSSLPDYWFECEASGVSGRIGHSCKGDNFSGVLNPIAATPGQATATVTLVDAETSEPLATASLTIKGTVSTEEPSFTPTSNVYIMVGSEFPLDVSQMFEGNTAAQVLFLEHSGTNGEFITDLSIGDPSILELNTEIGWGVRGIKSGTSTVTITTCTGETYTNTVTVKQWADLDVSQLKFVQHELNLTSGEFLWNGDLLIEGITGQESVGGSFYIATSNNSILNYPLPEDESITGDGGGNIRLTACKPGTAKLYLYFYNPETEKSILTDTMTVNVKAAETTATSTPDSSYKGDIISSGAADDIVKDEGLSLTTNVKSPDSLTADQRQGLLEVTNATEGEKAVLVDISLVRPNGTTFDGYDELDGDYVFTVRMKLEGNLANLDPETLSVYRIHEDGEMEPVTCWVHDGYLYIATDHFSPYAIVGQAKSATGSNTGTAGNGSQGNGTGTGDTQGGGTTTAADKGGTSGTSVAKNDAAKTSGATRSGTPLAQTGDSLLPLAAALGVAAILGAAGLAVARRRMNRW